MEALARRALQISEEFNSQDVANTAWSFATLGVKDADLMEALARRALEIPALGSRAGRRQGVLPEPLRSFHRNHLDCGRPALFDTFV